MNKHTQTKKDEAINRFLMHLPELLMKIDCPCNGETNFEPDCPLHGKSDTLNLIISKALKIRNLIK